MLPIRVGTRCNMAAATRDRRDRHALASSVLCSTTSEAQSSNNSNSSAHARLAPAELSRLLRTGGYTMYFRHATTEVNPDESDAPADEDCGRQRNLSVAGREQARDIGVAIRQLDIPIGMVLAGPLCRTQETARLIFGRAETDPQVRGGGLGRPDYPGLRALVSRPVPTGINQAIVGHGHQFRIASRMNEELAEGEAAIIGGMGDGRFEIVARIRSEQWVKLKPVAGGG